MSVQIVFRKMKSTEALKDHVEKKVEKFQKFVQYPIETHVILSLEKTVHSAEITVHAEHREIVASTDATDLYEAIDLTVHKIENQLKKEREKHKGHTKAHRITTGKKSKLTEEIIEALPHEAKRAARKER